MAFFGLNSTLCVHLYAHSYIQGQHPYDTCESFLLSLLKGVCGFTATPGSTADGAMVINLLLGIYNVV